MKDKKITIAIQKSGRLSDNSKNLLEKSGINFRTSGEKLLARSSNMNIDILLVRDDDIPSLVSKGVADLGIVGENVLAEQTATNTQLKAYTILSLGFSKCSLAFAKPSSSRMKNLSNKAIATSYPGLVKKYLKQNKIKAEIIKINGSVELTPYIGIADCICDLVSSGATLEANNLIQFKTLMSSEAVLIGNERRKSIQEPKVLSLVKRFEGVINAAESKYVMLNAEEKSINRICKLLPGADSPTIIPLQEKGKVAIHALCTEPVFWETMENLKTSGASSILVMPVEKILY
ncbi:ATP phosphoribosyltransferase [Gammaproteobacteria bacterium]|nr:ATP phosphoribosyltransferase [Gammaproteobacteria bacterium]MDA9370733.1 ATP phosphoribosyltransferase [Gammaproteobacteria bacterium]MDB9700533.1 ATP phosphoribosyltransferase [Gammaproteobacteria bacterium]MDB9790778.1 ATP phosphoribosyltransferase [Gammaproteobacteria bacterium]MDB9896154.1 ATP phosphoribosyltransferase [Gammaproteobacteria bacterium]